MILRLLVALLLPQAAQAVERHFNFTVIYRLSMIYGENCSPFGQHCEPSFRVYERDGDACPRCGGTVKRAVQQGRSTYWCSGCQR